MANQIQSNVTVDISTLKTIVCECGSILFDTVFAYKIVPAVYSTTGKPTLIALSYLRCTNCGKVVATSDLLNDPSKFS